MHPFIKLPNTIYFSYDFHSFARNLKVVGTKKNMDIFQGFICSSNAWNSLYHILPASISRRIEYLFFCYIQWLYVSLIRIDVLQTLRIIRVNQNNNYARLRFKAWWWLSVIIIPVPTHAYTYVYVAIRHWFHSVFHYP